MPGTLTVAQYDTDHQYWEGGNYELNMSFDLLRDKQWPLVMQTLWEHPAIRGPFAERYAPRTNEADHVNVPIQTPPPTATLNQHAQIKIGDQIVGCDVQATRSLFECVSVLVPVRMFQGVQGGPQMRQMHPELESLDAVFYNIALHIYDVVPFKIAAIGYERTCQLVSELQTDFEARHNFLVLGNFIAQESVLQEIEPDLTPYKQVRPDLRHMPAKGI